jgi:hypothetical protein
MAFAPAVAAAAEQLSDRPRIDVEGSLPVQYVDTATPSTRTSSVMYAPYLKLMATSQLQPGLTTSVFAEGGHDPLGRFRDNDNTSANFGINVVRRWGGFSVGVALEHSYFYTGVFSRAPNVANGLNFVTRYDWRPNNDLRIVPSANVTIRFEDSLVLQRYLYGARIEIEQRLWGSWWFIATPRFRYAEGVNDMAGRRDFTLSVVTGLKYEFTENVSFVTLIGYENRSSSISSRNMDRFVGGVSLDFKFSPRLP